MFVMSVARRRVMLYWLLLILPALAVGVGTTWMLLRERMRLAEQAMETAESRQDAVRERARLVVEGVESLMADVQNLLAISLREAPLGYEQRYLSELRDSNALVAEVFGADSQGEVLWGATEEAVLRWVAERPWAATPRARVVESPETRLQYDVPAGDFPVVTNRAFSAQVNARSELQQEASKKIMVSDEMRATSAREKSKDERTDLPLELRVVTWTTSGEGKTVSILAWMPTSRGLYVGLALDTTGLIERIRATLPQELATDERYLLSDGASDVSYARFPDFRADALAHFPLSSALLPGWQVEGFWLGDSLLGPTNQLGVMLSMMLVVILVVAIIAGGGLLLREARLSAKEAEQRVSFVSHVSHEFKTPLTTIRMYAELLAQDRVKGESKRAEYFEVIGQETGRLTRLVNNALEFGRLEQGERELDVSSIDVGREIGMIAETQSMRLESQGIVLVRLGLEGKTEARADRDVLHHIVLNLVDNVCKYAASGNELSLEIRLEAGGAIQVVVGDRGPGVGEADRERIFAKFSRLDDALTSEQKGAGLGLSISRELARRMGGDLAYSAREGGGSEFILTLP